MKEVLIVDDEFDLTRTIKAILEHHGYGAETCSTGREALDCIREAHPDLILLDVMIPLGNGYEVVRRVRHECGLSDLPVVLMNNVPPPDSQPVLWQAFLQKPLSIRLLIEAVEDLIGPP